ncbi:DNA cytosine methyltransferase [Lentzea sp. NEAU-D7]|uniref:DNA cytosine methyltransferase n=1 Tax=Lentzea sp. NEAU-D7 TaxID=2994667 RepID=UPI00224AD1DD|nr:DNA cytosine methyltransferase [Lentzea sp. NEAU-D7]MCX2949984.1 DNA cytosine methyltransferase [Lentzea sp. NEAU-D7]
MEQKRLRSLEVCAGAGGLALGLERAGFDPVVVLDNRDVACETLRLNRPDWDVRQMDLLDFDPADDQRVYDVDLLSAGLPRVKSSAATNRPRGSDVELRLLDATIMLMHGVQPRALLIENVPDLATSDQYLDARKEIAAELVHLGYSARWLVVNSSDYRVPQDRKQGVLVAFKDRSADDFELPPAQGPAPSVGAVLLDSMASRGWTQAAEWAAGADRPAPTLVGGSWNRGGPDLGPTGSKRAWEAMGVNGGTVADFPPPADFHWDPTAGPAHMVQLTVAQAALLQGFPADWRFAGGKTKQYRQVGNASPPPVGHALGLAIRKVLDGH